MTEPNVLSYFLIILGGFGAVWAFRFVMYFWTNKKPITEFEYAGFSTVWGCLVFLLWLYIMRDKSDVISSAISQPFVATPSIFILGASCGLIAALVIIFLVAPFLKRLRR